jgi:hypothetical protein
MIIISILLNKTITFFLLNYSNNDYNIAIINYTKNISTINYYFIIIIIITLIKIIITFFKYQNLITIQEFISCIKIRLAFVF